MDLNQLSSKAHENAKLKGFWDNIKSYEHYLTLVITEIAEAVEADRTGQRADVESYNHCLASDDIFESDMECYIKQSFEKLIKNSVEDELADTAIRLLNLAAFLQIDFTRLCPSRYYRVFSRFSFTENAYTLIKGLCRDQIAIEMRVPFAIDYLQMWAESLGIDLEYHIQEKIIYSDKKISENVSQ
jgi:NTP pyrophosphatase (non-canonical NTP hydrolase)